MGFEIKLTDNSAEILAELAKNKAAALEVVGQNAVSHAKNNVRATGLVDTGRLRNSITHTTRTKPGTTIQYKTDKKGTVLVDSEVQVQIDDEDKVVIGTAVEYGVYQEYGTGIYAEGGTGRKTPWRYRVFNRETGKFEFIITRGTKPKHFLRNAIANHQKEYIEIIKKYLKGNN